MIKIQEILWTKNNFFTWKYFVNSSLSISSLFSTKSGLSNFAFISGAEFDIKTGMILGSNLKQKLFYVNRNVFIFMVIRLPTFDESFFSLVLTLAGVTCNLIMWSDLVCNASKRYRERYWVSKVGSLLIAIFNIILRFTLHYTFGISVMNTPRNNELPTAADGSLRAMMSASWM